MAQVIELPYTPRKIFLPYHARSQRFAAIVAHRRAGKTVAVVNDQIRNCLNPSRSSWRAAYIAPLFKQAKAIAWDYVKEFTAPVPGRQINESELRIDFPNGSRYRLFGADNYDGMRGLYFDDAALDEPADFPANAWPTVIRPALSDRQGCATFIGTPKGKNDFWDISERARKSEDWFYALHRASETKLLPQHELSAALAEMGEDRYAQEFECSFEAAIIGAYYGREMGRATREGRVSGVPYDPSLPVVTAWDLGMGDSTAIWFAQFAGQERRLVDYYETAGAGLDHYVKVLKEKPYLYAQHILPHDVEVRELGTGKSRREVLSGLGLNDILVAPKLPVDDGIQASRAFIALSWFDEQKCRRGIEALRQYRRDYDEKGRTFRSRPLHDWTSHGADAFRYLVTGYRPAVKSRPRKARGSAWAA